MAALYPRRPASYTTPGDTIASVGLQEVRISFSTAESTSLIPRLPTCFYSEADGSGHT